MWNWKDETAGKAASLYVQYIWLSHYLMSLFLTVIIAPITAPIMALEGRNLTCGHASYKLLFQLFYYKY